MTNKKVNFNCIVINLMLTILLVDFWPVRLLDQSNRKIPEKVIAVIKKCTKRKDAGHNGIINSAFKNFPIQYAGYLTIL